MNNATPDTVIPASTPAMEVDASEWTAVAVAASASSQFAEEAGFPGVTPPPAPAAKVPTKKATPVKTGKVTAQMAAPAYQPSMRISVTVEGSTLGKTYEVAHGTWHGKAHIHGWSCTCEDYFYRHSEKGTHCKHIRAVTTTYSKEHLALLMGNG